MSSYKVSSSRSFYNPLSTACFSIIQNKILTRFASTIPVMSKIASHYLSPNSFRPSYAYLKESIWAVHATKVLPKNAALHPFFDHPSWATCWNSPDKTPAVISNTIHFALGGLVPSHGPYKWEHRPFAIVTPLGTLIDKIVNVFAHDTIILGKWDLKKESVLLVPEGTDTTTLQGECFTTVSYDKSKLTLKTAVDNVIREKNGLPFKMPDQSVLLGSEALLDGKININTPIFFENLLNKYSEKLSFGDACHSQIGDAYLLGFLRSLSEMLVQSKRKAQIYVIYTLLEYFFEKAKNKYFTEKERLHIEKLLLDMKKEIPPRSEIIEPIWPFISPDFLHGLTWEELIEFKHAHQDLFDKYNQHEYEGSWAACRWFVVGYQQGLKEGLDKIFDKEFELFLSLNESPQMYSLTLKALLDSHNKSFSDRLQIVESILNIANVQKYRRAFVTLTSLQFPLKALQAISKSDYH